jgi:hypothetical protein
MRRQAVKHENFLIAKICDSESAQRLSGRHWRAAAVSCVYQTIGARAKEMPAVQSLPAMLIFADLARARVFRFVCRVGHRVVDVGTSRFLTSVRQYFLKLEAVFFGVLVYSGCSASRFPSARSD